MASKPEQLFPNAKSSFRRIRRHLKQQTARWRRREWKRSPEDPMRKNRYLGWSD